MHTTSFTSAAFLFSKLRVAVRGFPLQTGRLPAPFPRPLRLPPCLAPLSLAALGLAASGCGNGAANIGLGVLGGGTAVGAYSPAQEIEQVYYLGIFDPHEQLQPQQVYRVTVHGQASLISQMKFGSGWVPANFVDSLSTSAGFSDDSDRPTLTGSGKEPTAGLTTGRRLVLFGPEGFREAPKDYRLVIVMGASPKAFFKAIDQSIGVISQVRREQNNPQIVGQLLKARQQLTQEQQRLTDLSQDVTGDTSDSSKGNPS